MRIRTLSLPATAANTDATWEVTLQPGEELLALLFSVNNSTAATAYVRVTLECSKLTAIGVATLAHLQVNASQNVQVTLWRDFAGSSSTAVVAADSFGACRPLPRIPAELSPFTIGVGVDGVVAYAVESAVGLVASP